MFPELGLTGYLLQDLAAEVAMRRDDAASCVELAAATAGISAVVSFVEESDDHRLFIAAALLEDGALRHVHRKVFLPTYGLFDERRFFAAGGAFRAVRSDRASGLRLGICVCEDFWHLSSANLLALDGAQVLINVSSSPGRDVAAINEEGLGTATSWRTLNRAYAQLTTSFVVFVNRVGVDESFTFWGGSEVVGPTGATVAQAPLHDEGLFLADLELGGPAPGADRGARCCATSDRRSCCASWSASCGRRAGEEEVRQGDERDRRAVDAGLRAAGGAGHRHRRRAAHHRRVHPGAAAAGRASSKAVLGLSGRHRLGARRVPRRGGHRRGPAAHDHDALPDLVARLAGRTRRRSCAQLGCATELVEITPMVDGYFEAEDAATPPRCAAATSWRAPG